MARAAGDGTHYQFRLVAHDGQVKEVGFGLPSVTTIIKSALGGPPPEWGYKLAVEGVARLVSDGLRLPADVEELKTLLKEETETPWSVRDAGGVRGTRVHGYFEALAAWSLDPFDKLGGPQEPEPLPEDGYEQAVLSWWQKVRPRVVASEEPLFSLAYGFAGTCDLVFETGNRSNPTRVLMDLKTHKPVSKRNPARVEDRLQNGAYRLAWEERHPDLPIHETRVLVACEDGSFYEDTRPDLAQGFLALLDFYKEVKK